MASDDERKPEQAAGRPRRTPLILFVAVLVAILATLGWLFGTDSGARSAFSALGSLSSGVVQADGVSGRLAGPLRVERLTINRENDRFTLADLRLDWRPAALLRGSLHVTSLRIGRLGAVSKMQQTKEPARLPDSISLPLKLQVDSVQVDGGDIAWGPVNLIELGAFAFNLDFDGERYRFGLDRLAARSKSEAGAFAGTFSGQATLSAAKPYALQGTIASGGEALIEQRAISAKGRVDLSGSLEEVATAIDLAINQAQVKGRAVLRPFSEQPLGGADLAAHALDLSAFSAGLPKTALDINLNAAENGAGELALTNAAAGLYNDARIPLTSLQIAFRQDDGQFTFDRIAASLGSARRPAGVVSGSGRYANGALMLTLQTAALDVQRLDQRARATRLAGSVDIRHADGRQTFTVALSEPLKKNKLTLSAHAVLADDSIAIDRAELRVGNSAVDASAQVDLAGKQTFSAKGRVSRFRLQDLGDFPQLPALLLNGDFSLRGARQPQLEADLAFRISDSRLAGNPLVGEGQARLHADTVDVPKLLLAAGANQLSIQGKLSEGDTRLTFALNAPALQQLGPEFGGTMQIEGSVRGNVQRPRITAEWKGSGVRAPGPLRIDTLQGAADIALDRSKPLSLNSATIDTSGRGLHIGSQQAASVAAQVRFSPQPNAPIALTMHAEGIAGGQLRADRLDAVVAGTTAQHTFNLSLAETQQNWKISAGGGLRDLDRSIRWQGAINAFDASGRFNARLAAPAALLISQQRVQLDQFRLDANSAYIAVEQFVREPDRVATRGRFERLQVGELLRYLDPAPPVSADLRLGGEWDINLGDTLAGSFGVRREGGDVVMRGSAPVALGLRTLNATATAVNGRVALKLQAEGQQLGRVDVNANTAIGGGETRLSIAPDAPVSGNVRIDIPSLGWVGPLVSPTLVAEGRLQSDISVAGSFGQPRFDGKIAGDALRLLFTDTGVDLRQGVLRSEFRGDQLVLQKLGFQNGGSLTVSGPISLAGGQIALQLALNAERYTLIDRSDRKLVISGNSQIGWSAGRAKATGAFQVNSGLFDIGRADMPQLSDDVVIVGRNKKSGTQTAAELDISIALGDGITLRGRGLNAQLVGEIRLLTGADNALRAQGTLRVAKGTYSAYGRELAIEQGLLRFSGPLNNPALDILAMRRGQEVEAGVLVGGTVLAPRVTLVSEPSVPDAEKLSWLVLGRGLSSAGSGDIGALQSAASALLAEGAAAGLQSQLATAFGLDDFSIGSAAGTGTTLQERIVTLGKRISSKLYVSFQQGLEGATSVLLLRYTLSPRLTLETEAGTRSAVSLFYNFAFD